MFGRPLSVRFGCFVLSLGISVSPVSGGASIEFDFSPDPLARFRQPASLQLVCAQAETPPRIDGQLDDEAWGVRP